MAFFQSGALPAWMVRLRRALPRTLSVLTLVTLTLNNSCTACRICGLVARRSATMVYWLYFSPWRVPFSVRRTVLMISKAFMLFLGKTGFDFFKRALGEQQFVGAQHVVSVQRIAGGQRDFFKVARGKRQIFINAGGNDERRAFQIQRGNNADKILGLRRGELQIVHDDHVTELEAFAQGFAQRELLGFLGDALGEITGLRAEHHASTRPQRGTDGAGTGTTGAFLFPRLLVGTLDFAGGLGAGGAATL